MITYAELRQQGFTVTRTTDDNFVVIPSRKLTPDLRERIKANKESILSSLRDIAKPDEPEKSKAISPAKQMPTKVPGGVGTEITTAMPTAAKLWAALKIGGCGCKDKAKQWDSNGITWCRTNETDIVEYLVRQSPIGIRSLESTYDTATSIVDNAIESATTKEAEHFATLLTRKPLVDLPSDSVIITAADDRFVAGATLLAWTALQQHRANVRVYDLGISPGPMRDQLLSWGVDIVKPDPNTFAIPKGVATWQIWNKPIYIADALNDFAKVIWLDADTCVGGDLSSLLAGGMLVPDHGGFDAKGNKTREPITELLGPDRIEWNLTNYPCAGVIGLGREDFHVVHEWIRRTDRVYDADVHQHCQYYDQSVLQTFFTNELISGATFNSFGCPRQGDQRCILQHIADYPERAVHHFGGKRKPFLNWPSFNWPRPRGAK